MFWSNLKKNWLIFLSYFRQVDIKLMAGDSIDIEMTEDVTEFKKLEFDTLLRGSESVKSITFIPHKPLEEFEYVRTRKEDGSIILRHKRTKDMLAFNPKIFKLLFINKEDRKSLTTLINQVEITYNEDRDIIKVKADKLMRAKNDRLLPFIGKSNTIYNVLDVGKYYIWDESYVELSLSANCLIDCRSHGTII